MTDENDPINSLVQILDSKSPEQMEGVLNSLFERIASKVSESLPPAFDRATRKVLRNLGYSEEVSGLVHLLAARSNDSKQAVLQKALTLYGLALDAREKGNRLAILSPDDVIVHEVIGFEPEDMAIQNAVG